MVRADTVAFGERLAAVAKKTPPGRLKHLNQVKL